MQGDKPGLHGYWIPLFFKKNDKGKGLYARITSDSRSCFFLFVEIVFYEMVSQVVSSFLLLLPLPSFKPHFALRIRLHPFETFHGLCLHTGALL